MLLDDIIDRTNALYNAPPKQLYLIDWDGVVCCKTVFGSMNSKPEEKALAINMIVGAPN